MSEILLDCRKLQCPQPVIQARGLLQTDRPERLVMLVDNEPALENVTRFLSSQGYATSFEQKPGLWRITGVAGAPPAAVPCQA